MERSQDVLYRFRLEPSLRFEYVSPSVLGFTGYSAEELCADPTLWARLVHPDDRHLVSWDPTAADGIERPLVVRWIRRDGSIIWTENRSVPVRDGTGRVIAVEGMARDISEARRVEAERTLLAAAIEQSTESVVITDTQARITYVNQAFERISGYAAHEVIGSNPRLLKSGVQSTTFYDALWAALSNGVPWVAQMTNRRKDGSRYQLECVISPIRDADRTITGYVSVGRDVSRERELEGQADRLTRERSLIGDTLRRIPPAASVEATAELFCRQVARLTDIDAAALVMFESDGSAVPISFIVRDAEDVPLCRHTTGHSRHLRDRAAAGPWVEAWRPHRAYPSRDPVATAGIRAFAYAPVSFQGTVIGVLKVGSATDDAMSVLASQLAAIVDFADLAGALLGRRVGDGREMRRRRAAIERIIAEQTFHPVFQPIVDMASRMVIGYEALTRFDDGVGPDIRFGDADVVGVGIELEAATLAGSLAASGALPQSRFLHLNVSPALVLERTRLRHLLAGRPGRIVLEVTEHVPVTDYDDFRSAIDGLGGRVLLAVDDAGAGFASFRHVLELRPAFMKLDISLVRGIDEDPAKQALVAGMRHFARMTHRRLIAEGVETEREAATLMELGVRLGQGYLFGRPTRLPPVD